jgi:SdrD B-like domain/FlgD Ig-like domain
MASPRWCRLRHAAGLVFAVSLALAWAIALAGAPSVGAAGSSTISGVAFRDTDRDGVQDPGEAPFAGQGVIVTDAAGQNQIATTATDANGGYRFTGLADGTYLVQVDPSDWNGLRRDWVPSTTGSVWPRKVVSLSGSATLDLGWRPITRSTTMSAPISSYTGPNGLVVKSYNDAVGAREIYDDLMTGGLIGAEAAHTTVMFDFGDTNVTSMSASGSEGAWETFAATSQTGYVTWLDKGDATLFHEYGHAWSLYFAHMVQQDSTLTAYLKARGISGDPRLESSHAWAARELIAEDYRQLFGTANARAMRQENTDLPPAADVPGLRDFLATTFRQPPASGGGGGGATPPPPSPPPPAPALSVTGLSMNPSPVKSSGTASFNLSAGASVTVVVRDSKGSVVRTLLHGASKSSGGVSAAWDRKTSSGSRAKSGTYTVAVDAVDSSGVHATATKTFTVS